MTKSVMVVDEDISILERMRTLLEEENINVTTVKTNREAMEILDREKSIDAVLLHARMPDGRDVFVPLVRKDDKTLPLDIELSRDCGKEEIMRFLSKLSNL